MNRSIVAVALMFLASCSSAPTPQAPPRRVEGQTRPPMTQWFYSDGMLLPDSAPPRSANGQVQSPAREWLVLANLAGRTTVFRATYYFEDIAPRSFSGKIEARRSRSYALQDKPDLIPPGKLYGARIESDGPLLVQASRGEYEPNNPVTHAMASFIAYPGPLGVRETRWAYADGLVLQNESPLEEWEWISILNPSASAAASVCIRFLRSGHEREYRLSVPAERVRSVDLFHLPEFTRNQLTSVVVESDQPVVVEQIRRAYTRGIPVIASLWATFAYPCGDQKME
jgi:hypothetical protein